jgi:hypothetical protein
MIVLSTAGMRPEPAVSALKARGDDPRGDRHSGPRAGSSRDLVARNGLRGVPCGELVPRRPPGKLIEIGLANNECAGWLEQLNSLCLTVWGVGVGRTGSRCRKIGEVDVVFDRHRYAIKRQATVPFGRKGACLTHNSGFFTQANEDRGIIDLPNAPERGLDRLDRRGRVGPVHGQERKNGMGYEGGLHLCADPIDSMRGGAHRRQARRLRIFGQGRLTVVLDSRHVYLQPGPGGAGGMASVPHSCWALRVPRCPADEGVAGSKRNRGFKAADVA